MSVTDEVKSKKHIEVRDEVLSIQKYAICIASNHITTKLTVHKERVDEFTLDYLSAYFNTPIIPATDDNERLLVVKNDNCEIFIEQEKHE